MDLICLWRLDKRKTSKCRGERVFITVPCQNASTVELVLAVFTPSVGKGSKSCLHVHFSKLLFLWSGAKNQMHCLEVNSRNLTDNPTPAGFSDFERGLDGDSHKRKCSQQTDFSVIGLKGMLFAFECEVICTNPVFFRSQSFVSCCSYFCLIYIPPVFFFISSNLFKHILGNWNQLLDMKLSPKYQETKIK